MRNGRPDLYLGMFARNHPNLAVLGFIEFASAAYANYAAMAELIVADATAANGSTVQRRFADLKANHHPDLKGSHHYVNSERHANYVDVDAYLRTIAQVKAQVQDGVGLSMFDLFISLVKLYRPNSKVFQRITCHFRLMCGVSILLSRFEVPFRRQ